MITSLKTFRENLDKVGEEDIDMNNDGEVDKSDFYLLNRRRKIKKAIKEGWALNVIGEKHARMLAKNMHKFGANNGIELPMLKAFSENGPTPGVTLEALEEMSHAFNNGNNPKSLRFPFEDTVKLKEYIESLFPNKTQMEMLKHYGEEACAKVSKWRGE